MANDKATSPNNPKPESFISVDELIDHIVRKASDLTGHQIERRENRWRAVLGILFGAITASGFAGLFYFVDQQIRTTKQEIITELSAQMTETMATQFAQVQNEVRAVVDERFRENVEQATALTNFHVITNVLHAKHNDRDYDKGDAAHVLLYLERLSEDYGNTQDPIFLTSLERLINVIYENDDWTSLREVDRLIGESMRTSAPISRLMYSYFAEEFLSQISIDEHNRNRFAAYLSHRTDSWYTQISRDYAHLAWLLYQDEKAGEDETAQEIENLLRSIWNASESARDWHQGLVRGIYRRHKAKGSPSHENILMAERIEEISSAYGYPPEDYLAERTDG